MTKISLRPAVGMMVVNDQKKVFVAKRCHKVQFQKKKKLWQMPQGGIDSDEIPQDAMFRELREEIGTDSVEIIAESTGWFSYLFPIHTRLKPKYSKYKGQNQKWYLVKLLGGDELINIHTLHPEFEEWKWVDYMVLPDIVVHFKKNVYQSVLNEFAWYFNPPHP